MEDKIEILSQALRFSKLPIFIDLFLLAHFYFSWRRSWKKTGWKIDFWYFTLFLNFFVFVLCMYPFNGSVYNVRACGPDFFLLDEHIDKAFYITILGYLAIWIGRYIYDFIKRNIPLLQSVSIFVSFEKLIEKNIRSRSATLFLILPIFFSLIFVCVYQIKEDCIFNPRKYFMENRGTLLLLFLLTLALFQIGLTFFSIRYIHFKRKTDKYLLILLFVSSLFLGIRAITISSLLTFIVYRIFANQGNFKFLRFCFQCSLLTFLGLLISLIRNQQLTMGTSLITIFGDVFYGNHFSDTRDFAWVLAYWDDTYLLGKSYLAGFLSFVPGSLIEFKREWFFSHYTNSLVGFGPEHPGLRPGLFGEAYFNFGCIGVIFLGGFVGYFIRYSDCKIKEMVNTENDIIKGFSKTLPFIFVSNLFITTGFFGLYIFIFINLLLYTINKLRFASNHP